MFKKKFSISLIILSTIIYGSVFATAKYHDTSFFDEMLIQLNRAAISISKKQEIAQSKFILQTIIENEHPPQIWDTLISHNPENDDTQLFYYYKIWTIKTKLNTKDIKDSYPIFESSKNNITMINMRYGKNKPIVQFPFFRDKDTTLNTGLFFPINATPISADYNNDNKVNYDDILALKKNI